MSVKTNLFTTFFLDRNLKEFELICNLGDRKTIFFPVVKSEINCASAGLFETTKTSLPCSPAVDQSVSCISHNSVPLRILLSRIPRKKYPRNSPAWAFGVLVVKSLMGRFVVWYR